MSSLRHLRNISIILAIILFLMPGCSSDDPLKEGDLALLQGNTSSATEFYQQALAAGVDAKIIEDRMKRIAIIDGKDELHLTAARELMKAGDYYSAVSELKTALSIDEQNQTSRLLLAESLVKLSHIEEARRELEELLRHEPVDADIYYLLARCYHERGSYIETRKYLNKALRTKTNHINSQKMLAQVDQEIIELNKCRKNEGLQEFEVGVRAFYAGNFQKAAEAFTASLAAKLPEATGKKEQFPLIADILMEEYSQLSLYSNLVLSWQKLNRQEEALGYLVAANEVLEPSPWIYFKIGKIYEKKGYWKQAGSRYMAARQLDPKLPGLSSALGFVYKKLGRYDLSVNEFEKEVSENPENPVARYNLAIMYKKVEKTKEARQELEMLRSKLEPGTRFYYTVEEHLENLEARKQ